jgi:hypothetical protein
MKRVARNWSRWKAERFRYRRCSAWAARTALAANKKVVDDQIRIINGLSFFLPGLCHRAACRRRVKTLV